MKKFYTAFFATILLASAYITGNAQCSSAGASLNGTIVPTTSWQTINTFSYYYYKFVATAGNVYIFSYCPCEGGSISYQGAITIDSSNNTAVTGDGTYTNFNEGYCTTAKNPPQVTWQCFASGTYKVLTTHRPCATTAGTSATMAYKMETPSLCYTVASTAYSPDSYTTGTTVPGMNVDDAWSTTAEPIGFSFCFNGTYYDSVMISSNGNLIFTGAPCYLSSEIKNAGFSSYTTNSIPFSNTVYTAFEGPGVDFPWIDAYPIGGGTIKFKTYGISPNKHFTVAYNNVELFQCTAKLMTTEVQLYQTTNNIEIQSDKIPSCPGWTAGGHGVEGLVDETEFAAVVPPGRNKTPAWTVTSSEAWLFTPSCCTPLPIRLLNFQCSSKGNAIALNWATATETNNKYFTIVRSQDGMNFMPIARIAGAGNSSTTRYYSYLDTTALNGTNYYKIDQTDFDGATTESYITSCDAVKLQAGAIYPNPTTNSFTVVLGPSTQPTQVTISDIIGRQVLSRQYVPSAVYTSPIISVQQLQKGIYFVRISNGQQTLVRKLVIK